MAQCFKNMQLTLFNSRYICNVPKIYTKTGIHRVNNAPPIYRNISVNSLDTIHTMGCCARTHGRLLLNRYNCFRQQCSNNLHQMNTRRRRRPDHFEDMTNTRVEADTLLFHYYNRRHYLWVSAFACTGTMFFLFMADSLYNVLPQIPTSDEDEKGMLKKINLKKSSNRTFFGLLSILGAVAVISITSLYIRRTVKELWLLKGGESVRILTYRHFGRTSSAEFPLDNIKPLQGRGNRNIQLRIKNHWFKYYMDKNGVFPNPVLYDFSAGMGRQFH